MRLLPKSISLRKGVTLYRRIRYRKGFGVHSPFVFNLITRVVEESRPYYIFHDIEKERAKLLCSHEQVTYPDHRQRLKTCSVSKIAEQEFISRKQGMLLFRLANYLHSKRIIQLGSGMGVSTLYLNSYASDLQCIVLENVSEYAKIASSVFLRQACHSVDLRVGEYHELFPQALVDMGKVDFIFFHDLYEQTDYSWLFNQAVKHVHSDTVFVFEGIKSTRRMREFWKETCNHPDVTVTVDLYSLGLVFFNPKLYKRNYKTYL